MTDPLTAPLRQSDDNGRFYFWTDPTTEEEHRFWSVTTALSAKSKDGLKWWAAKLAARRAMDNLPMMLRAQRHDPCERTWLKNPTPARCDVCPDCVQRWIELFHAGESERRKHEGSAIHDLLEAYILGNGDLDALPNAATLAQRYLDKHPTIVEFLDPYIVVFKQWIIDFAVRPGDFEAAEMTIFNSEHEYGGTLDALWRIVARNERSAKLLARITGRTTHEAALVVVDAKTREGEDKKFYNEHALQLAAYRRATHAMPDKVTRLLSPMPTTVGGVILQIRPDGYTCEPVVTDDWAFSAFLNTLNLFRWTVEDGAASIAVKSFPVPDGFSFNTVEAPAGAPKKRAPRKTAPKKTAEPGVPTTAATKGSPRMQGATLGGIARTGFGRPGAMLTDADIPF